MFILIWLFFIPFLFLFLFGFGSFSLSTTRFFYFHCRGKRTKLNTKETGMEWMFCVFPVFFVHSCFVCFILASIPLHWNKANGNTKHERNTVRNKKWMKRTYHSWWFVWRVFFAFSFHAFLPFISFTHFICKRERQRSTRPLFPVQSNNKERRRSLLCLVQL